MLVGFNCGIIVRGSKSRLKNGTESLAIQSWTGVWLSEEEVAPGAKHHIRPPSLLLHRRNSLALLSAEDSSQLPGKLDLWRMQVRALQPHLVGDTRRLFLRGPTFFLAAWLSISDSGGERLSEAFANL